MLGVARCRAILGAAFGAGVSRPVLAAPAHQGCNGEGGSIAAPRNKRPGPATSSHAPPPLTQSRSPPCSLLIRSLVAAAGSSDHPFRHDAASLGAATPRVWRRAQPTPAVARRSDADAGRPEPWIPTSNPAHSQGHAIELDRDVLQPEKTIVHGCNSSATQQDAAVSLDSFRMMVVGPSARLGCRRHPASRRGGSCPQILRVVRVLMIHDGLQE